MTNKEIGRIGKELLDGTDSIQNLRAFFNELDPPRPSSDTVVWWRPIGNETWELGFCVWSSVFDTVQIVAGDGHPWDINDPDAIQIEWKPAYVAPPDTVAELEERQPKPMQTTVTIHNTDDWPVSAEYVEVVLIYDKYPNTKYVQRVFGRTEVEAWEKQQ